MIDQDPPAGHKLNDRQWFTLRALADAIVPPSSTYAVPGAGDERICKEIIRDAGTRLSRLIESLEIVDTLAVETGAKAFSELTEAERERVAFAFRDSDPKLADRLALWVTQCYYRDERVLSSLGVDARPPFPEGYEVEAGDWSELDAVRKRAPLFRTTN